MMHKPTTIMSDFYLRPTASAEDTQRTCGNLFLLFGVFTFARTLPLATLLHIHNSELRHLVIYSLVSAASLAGFSILAGLVMHYEARESPYDACNEEEVLRRSGLALLLLTTVMFAPILIGFLILFFPFLLHVQLPEILFRVAIFKEVAALAMILPYLHSPWGLIAVIVSFVFSLAYVALCFATLGIAIRMWLEGFKSHQQGVVTWLTTQVRTRLNRYLDLNSAQGVYRVTGYWHLGLAAALILPALVYQCTMFVAFGKSTVVSETWFSGGTSISGTVVMALFSTVLLYLFCVSVTSFCAWKLFRKSAEATESAQHLAALESQRKWLWRASIATLVLGFSLLYGGSNFTSRVVTGIQAPAPMLLFAISEQSSRPGDDRIRLSISLFLWLQCLPLAILAYLAWLVSDMMQLRIHQLKRENAS